MAIFGKDISVEDLVAGNYQGTEKAPTQFGQALRYGIDQPTENLATTLEALGFDAQAKATRGLIDAPENYESAAARFMNPEGEGYNWRDLPLATIEQAGQLGGSILSRIGGAAIGGTAGPAGAIIGGLLGPGLFEAVQIAGPVALERARNNGREEPNGEDWAGAMGTAVFSGALNAVGTFGIPGLNSAILGTMGTTITKTVGAGVREGITEGLQGGTEQVGSTALTDKGLTIDPKQALGEGLLGASAGTAIQAPISVAQAVNGMGQVPPTTPGQAVDQMVGPQPPTTPDAAVETMAEATNVAENLALPPTDAVNERILESLLDDTRTQTETTQASLDTFSEAILNMPSDENQEANTRSAFINAFNDQMTQRVEEYGGTLPNDQSRRNALFDAQNYVIGHFEFFDPREPGNNINMIRDQVREAVDNVVDARLQAQSVDQAVLGGDKRFDTPTKRTIQDVYKTEEAVDRMGQTVQVPNIDYVPSGSPREGITSPETGIDPVFMSTTTLIPSLSNLPSVMSAEDAMKMLGIKEEGNWFVASKPNKANLVREAVDSSVASMLKAKKERKENVTREEIANQFYDHLSRFKTIVDPKLTRRSLGEGYKFEIGRDESEFMAPGPEDHIELWTMYDAKVPEGDLKEDSAYYNTINDPTHNPAGRGTMAWIRGTIATLKDGLTKGFLLDEIQSQIHEQGNDPGKPQVYLSKVSKEDEADIAPIRARVDDLQRTTNMLGAQIMESGNYANYPTLTKPLAEQIAKYMTGRINLTKDLVMPILSNELNEVSDEYASKNLESIYKNEAEDANTMINEFLKETPLEKIGLSPKLFTEETLLQVGPIKYRPTPFVVQQNIVKIAKENDVDLKEMSATEPNGDVAQAFEEIKELRRKSEKYSEKRKLANNKLVKEYINLLANKYPLVRDLSLKAEVFPNKKDLQRLEEFDKTRYDTPTVPDYPFKKNWPGMTVRTGIIYAIDNNLDYIFIPSKGKGGAPESVYKASQKQAKKIAQQISELSGVPANEIYTEVKDTVKSQGGPYYQLDLRQLKQLIEAKIFPGFVGYKKGGLVTKAQGAGYDINLGDYGRNYI